MTDKMRELRIAEVKAKMAQVGQRLAIIENPKSFDQIVTHMDSILLLLGQIREIEKQYPEIMDPPPDKLIPMMERTKEAKAATFAIKTADLNLEKAKVVSKKTTKTDLLDKAKMMIVEAKSYVTSQDLLDKLEAKLVELNSIE